MKITLALIIAMKNTARWQLFTWYCEKIKVSLSEKTKVLNIDVIQEILSLEIIKWQNTMKNEEKKFLEISCVEIGVFQIFVQCLVS